jgi:hypothetical protein
MLNQALMNRSGSYGCSVALAKVPDRDTLPVIGDRSRETSYGRSMMTCFMVMVHRVRDPRATVGVASTR